MDRFKYQSWIQGWHDTYLTSQFALFPLCIGITIVIFWSSRRFLIKRVPVLMLAILVSIGASSYVVRQYNSNVSVHLRSNLARWDAVSAIAEASYLWPEDRIVAPQLYYSRFMNTANWSEYWSAYVKKRFSLSLKFSPEFLEMEDLFGGEVVVNLHHRDDGRLGCLTVQSKNVTFLISEKGRRPPILADYYGNVISVSWDHAVRLDGGRFEVTKIVSPIEMVGVDKNLYPVWVMPVRFASKNGPRIDEYKPIPWQYSVLLDGQLKDLVDLLEEQGEDDVLMISARDDAYNSLSDEWKQYIDHLGGELSRLAFRGSYAAIFEGGRLVEESLRNSGPVELLAFRRDLRIRLVSAGLGYGNLSLVEVNGVDFSPNMRGLNVVVWNAKTNVLRRYIFDTCMEYGPKSEAF